MLEIFKTLEGYADLRLWLQDLKDRKQLSSWADAMRWYIENDLFFLTSEVMRDGQGVNLETGNRFYWDQFFVDWCREVEYQISKGGGFDGSARGVGKALALDTPVPTPAGWSSHGDLVVGDVVFDESGRPCEVEAVSEVWTDRDCYRVSFDDGTSIVADGSHEWVVLCSGSRRGATGKLETRDLAGSSLRYGRLNERVFSIPVCSAIQTGHVDLAVDPYVLGAWLGDGHTDCGRITNADAEVWDGVRRAGFELGDDALRGFSVAQTRTAYGLAPALLGVGVLRDKHIPGRYLRASAGQRLSLLQGLIDTDGYVNGNGHVEFCNTNRRLADGVVELGRSLGLKPRMKTGRATLGGVDCGEKFRVTFQAYADMPPVTIQRKASHLPGRKVTAAEWPAYELVPLRQKRHIESVEKVESVPTSCIQVSSSSRLYLAGEGMVPTHNSTIRTKGGNIQRLLKYPSSTGCIFSYQRRSSKKHFRSIKEELEENRILKTLFDDRLHWDPKAAARNGEIIWNNDDGLRMKGSNRKDMNLEYNAFFDGTPTGGRYDWMDFDDIEDHKAISSSDMLDKLHNTYDATIVLSTPVVLNPPVIMFTNTFYSEMGLANRVAKQFAAVDPRLARAVPGEDLSKPGNGPMGGTPVYPFTAQRLHWWHNQMRDRREYAIQICCSFLAGEYRTFQKDWFNYLSLEPEKHGAGKNIYICVDPSRGVTDPMAIWAWALGSDKKKAWVDASLKKLDPALPEFCQEVYMMLCKWQALGRRVVELRVENFGQATYDSMIRKYLEERGNYTEVVPCHDNFRSGKFSSGKRDREFERWAGPAASGEILIPKPLSLGGPGLVRPDETGRNLRCIVDYFLDNEWCKFPKPLTDNLLDAGSLLFEDEKRIGRILQYPPSAYKANAAERRSAARRESAMSMG